MLRRFDNRFDSGTNADQGAGIWSLPIFDASTCIAVTSYHRSDQTHPWSANRPRQETNRIGFEDSTDNDFNDAEILFTDQTPIG